MLAITAISSRRRDVQDHTLGFEVMVKGGIGQGRTPGAIALFLLCYNIAYNLMQRTNRCELLQIPSVDGCDPCAFGRRT